MKKLSPSRQRQRAKAEEAREIIARLTTPAVELSERELAFVLDMERRLKGKDYVTFRQMGWLRALELRHWGASELAQAVGEE